MRVTPSRIHQLIVCAAPVLLFSCDDGHETQSGGDGGVTTDGQQALSDGDGEGGGGDADGGASDLAGDLGGQEGADGPDEGAAACHEWAGAYCEKVKSCEPDLIEFIFGDEPACQVQMAAECAATLQAPDVRWKPEAQRACSVALAGQTCDEYWLGDRPAACRIVAGDRADGAYCAYSEQCRSLRCGVPHDSACGACTAPDGAPIRSACTVHADCEGALLCQSGTCVEPAAEGGSCKEDFHCRGHLVCISGACARPLAAGASCTRHAVCGDWSSCNQQRVCQHDSIVGLGARCGSLADGTYAFCRGSLDCDPTTHTCQPMPRPGEACAGRLACDGGARCVGGRCLLPDATTCPSNDSALATMMPMPGTWRGQTDERRPVTFIVAGAEISAFEMEVVLSLGTLGCLVQVKQVGSAPVVGSKTTIPIYAPFLGQTTLDLTFATPSSAKGRLPALRGGLLTCGNSLSFGTETTLGGPWVISASR